MIKDYLVASKVISFSVYMMNTTCLKKSATTVVEHATIIF